MKLMCDANFNGSSIQHPLLWMTSDPGSRLLRKWTLTTWPGREWLSCEHTHHTVVQCLLGPTCQATCEAWSEAVALVTTEKCGDTQSEE